MTLEERQDFLQGQMQALLGFAFGVIETHPDPATLRLFCQATAEGATAKTLPMPVTDACLQGIEDMRERLVGQATNVLGRRTKQSPPP